jgi:outer membrane protein W
MKKLILMSILIFILSISSYGQVEKGDFLLGGTGGVLFQKRDDLSIKTITLNPNIGYFATDKIATGMNVSVRLIYTKQRAHTRTHTVMGIAPFLRYYFLKKDKYALFGLASIGLTKGERSDYDNAIAITRTQAGLGFTYFLNKNIGLETILAYNNTKYQNAPNSTFNINLNVGFQIYFGGKNSESVSKSSK